MSELFASILKRIPKDRRKEMVIKMFPYLAGIAKTLNTELGKTVDDPEVWLDKFKNEDLVDKKRILEQRVERLFK